MTTIYISSTYEDLKEHRRKVSEALVSAGYHVIAMENYVATDQRPVDKCLKDVAKADIYVGIFGWRYGYVPSEEDGGRDGKSITELEFRQADSQDNTACLCFFWDPDAPLQPPRKFDDAHSEENDPKRIKALRAELTKKKCADFFHNPDHLANLVQQAVTNHLRESAASGQGQSEQAPPPIHWTRKEPPYPGLLHFTPEYESVFFGRELETNDVIDRLWENHRFIIVSGGSGSGKSSLVHAGVLPQLEKRRLPAADKVEWVRMLPSRGAHCFDALLRALGQQAERAGLNTYELSAELAANPGKLPDVLADIASKTPEGTALLLFLDQMEELFATRRSRIEKEPETPLWKKFLAGLYEGCAQEKIWVVATIRSDQLQPLYEHSEMKRVLSSLGHYCLGLMSSAQLRHVIHRPAQCAKVEVPPKLIKELAEDAGREPGNLPLLGFALRRLYEQAVDGAMSERAYDAWGGKDLGRLEGAIAEHAAEAEGYMAEKLGVDRICLERRLAGLFPKLVRVDAEGTPLRLRSQLGSLSADERAMVQALTGEKVRLLATDGEGESRFVSLAHEKLIAAWPTLAQWITQRRDPLRMKAEVLTATRTWVREGRPCARLWTNELLDRARTQLQAAELLAEVESDADVADFLTPEAERLIAELCCSGTDHDRREDIGRRLAEIGDPRPGVSLTREGLPDILWREIPGTKPGDEVMVKGRGKREVRPFQMAAYPVTCAQWQAFLEAGDGYRDAAWWEDLRRPDKPRHPSWAYPNYPVNTVTWHEATAFSRWLGSRLDRPVRLPDVWEWNWAAQSARPDFGFPWGYDWNEGFANTETSGIGRTIAVGMYPEGKSIQGVCDLAGNVWEWCRSLVADPRQTELGEDGPRVLRGGSWFLGRDDLRAASGGATPDDCHSSVGFRVVCGRPIAEPWADVD